MSELSELDLLRKRLSEVREELEESRFDESLSNAYWYGLSRHREEIETKIKILEALEDSGCSEVIVVV